MPLSLLPRGVFEMPVLAPNKSHCAVAVTREGVAVGWLWFDRKDEDATRRALWKMLEEADPEPALKVG